jgi:hypothetical protein
VTYVIYRNDGRDGEIITEVNQIEEPLIRNQPSRSSFLITNFPVNMQGQTFAIRIKVVTT